MKKRSNSGCCVFILILIIILAIIYLYIVYGNEWAVFRWLPRISTVGNPFQGILDSLSGLADSLINMITGLFR